MNLKHKIEALLFSSGRRMSVEEIAKLCSRDQVDVQSALQELKYDFEEKESSLMVVEEGNFWKITVKEEHLQLVTKIVTETELSKTLMETLAIIALKYPIKQADLIKMRTNKGYDHLKELEEMGYVTRQKYGRTKLIRLSQKFFDYFSLPEEGLKEKFKDFGSMAKAIEQKEEEIEKMKKEVKKQAEEEKKKSEVREKEVDLVDEEGSKVKLEVVNEKPLPEEQPHITEDKEKLGDLDVVEEKEEEVTEEESEEQVEETEETTEEDETEKSAEDSEVDKKVEELLHPKEESGEEVKKEASEDTMPEETHEEGKKEVTEEEKPEEEN
jgi:segregation and condensation protein B